MKNKSERAKRITFVYIIPALIFGGIVGTVCFAMDLTFAQCAAVGVGYIAGAVLAQTFSAWGSRVIQREHSLTLNI